MHPRVEQEQQAGRKERAAALPPRVEQEEQAGRKERAASLALDSELVDLAAQDISSVHAAQGIAVESSGSQAKKLLHGPLLRRCPDSLQNSSRQASVRSG